MIVTQRTITINRLTIVQNERQAWQVFAPDGSLLAAFPEKVQACLYAARRCEFATASRGLQQRTRSRGAPGGAAFFYGMMMLAGLPAGLGPALILLTVLAVFLFAVPLVTGLVRALSGAASATPLPMAQVVAVLGLAFLAAAGVGALFALALYRYTRLERLTTLLIVTPLYVATLLAPAVAVAGTCLGLLFAVLRVEGFTVLGTFVFGAGWLGGVLTLNRIFWNFRFAHDGA